MTTPDEAAPPLPDLVTLAGDGYPPGLPIQLGDRVIDTLEEAASISGRAIVYGDDGTAVGLA